MMFWPLCWCGLWLLLSTADAFAVCTFKIHLGTARQAYSDEPMYYDDEPQRPRRRRTSQDQGGEAEREVYYREPFDAMRRPPPFDYYDEGEEDFFEDQRKRPWPGTEGDQQRSAATSSTSIAPTDPRTPRPDRYRESYYEEDDDDMDIPPSGNFWSNPSQSVDRRSRSPPKRRRPPSTRSIPRRDYRPPDAALEFYQRFFWYGVDDDDDVYNDGDATSNDSDRTLFGGTKGKFNGLSFLGKDEDTRVRRRPRRDDVVWENDDGPPRGRPDMDEYSEAPRRRPREATAPPDDYYDDSRRNRFDAYESPQRPRRDTPPGDPPTPILQGMLEAFFGAREDPIAAARYDDIIQGKSRPPSRPRPGYAYPYERRQASDQVYQKEDVQRYGRRQEDFYDEEPFEDDNNRVRSPRDVSNPRFSRDEEDDAEEIVIDTETLPVEDSVSNEINSTQTLQNAPSWEERALAMERVPPDTIPAWGPTGELGMNAREKAVQDALEDLRLAEATVRDLEQKYRDAKEEIAVLRVDVELERRRLKNSDRLSPRQINDRLRRLDHKVEEASRASRLQQQRLEAVKQAEEDLKIRHWAVLRCYDPDLASEAVSEAVQETSEKLNLDGANSSTAGETDAREM